jgi:hypothetical protein
MKADQGDGGSLGENKVKHEKMEAIKVGNKVSHPRDEG